MEARQFKIGNMDCPGCAREVEGAVGKLEGVQIARVDFFSNTLQLLGDVDCDRLRIQVEAVGKTISDGDAAADLRGETKRTGVLGFCAYLWSRSASRPAIIGGALLLIAIAAEVFRLLPPDAGNLLYALAMLVAIVPIAQSGIKALRINRQFNINLLMTVAAVGALILGEFFEAALVIFLFAIGEALEGYTADRARDSLRSLIALKPPTANRIAGDQTETVLVESLQVGDLIRVLPGEGIPADASVIAGHSAVDQAHITGESAPMETAPGQEVFAGSINGAAALELRVNRTAEDSTLSRIIGMLQEAQSRRAPSQRQVDRFAHYYTPAVALAALALALIPPLFFGGNFLNSADGSGWLYRALSMLVIACPCALVISTPVTVISAISAAARRGVLIKGGVPLESLAGSKVIAFDKTGTLTKGVLSVEATYTDNCDAGPDCEPCAELISLAASVEAQSSHPFAGAILDVTAERGALRARATDVEALTGQGVRGNVKGKRITIGSHRFFDEHFDHTLELCARAAAIEESGKSAVMVHDGHKVRGLIALADSAREESAAVVAELSGLGIESVMLSGDNRHVAASIAEQVGVGRFYGELLPEDKLVAVEKLAAKHGGVAMVGDGINDAPALARASVGIAMGGAGSAQAMETADVVLMADGLRQLPRTIQRARFALRLIRENIVLSFGLKAVFLLLAATGNVTMLAAVFADMGMSLAVTLNGMRALRD
ncbi:MAG: cation-translocating P-type ATPase [Chloroflexota bacterium]|nr:cation-translocating P-type ATPase [Chloroflexota bacterium]MDE2907969.1 cation-translocating P-type ATPase [Chloroflexota bacterium]